MLTKFKFTACMFFIVFLNKPSAQTYEWFGIGPLIDIKPRAIANYDNDPNLMFAGEYGVLYKTTNSGETWELSSFYPAEIACIVMSAPGTIYIGTSDSEGIYKTENSGESWIHLGLSGARVNSIAIDNNDSNIIYAATGKRGSISTSEITGIFKSIDGGINWSHIYAEDIDCANDIIIDSDNSSILYSCITSNILGDNDDDFIKSTNAGESWNSSRVSNSTHSESYGLVQSPVNSSDLYCISVSGGNHRDLFRSTNKGSTWEEIHVYYYEGPVRAVLADPQNESIIYAYGSTFAVENRGFFKSTNKGNSWTNLTNEIPYAIYTMLVNPETKRFTIVGTNEGILQSETGIIWESRQANSYIADIAVHPNDDNIVFAAPFGKNLFKSKDGGGTWDIISSSVTNDNVVTFCPVYPDLVVAAGKYFHKSIDGGEIFDNHFYSYFNCSDDECDSSPEEILYHPTDTAKIVIGTSGEDGVLSMSSNGGREWGYINFSNTAFSFDPNDHNIIYAGTKNTGGIYRVENIWSENLNVVNISPLDGMGNVHDLEVAGNGDIFSAAADGLWYFDQSEWEKLTGLPDNNITAVALDDRYSTVYAGTESNGVYLSNDYGNTWSEFNNGLDYLSITKLEFCNNNPSVLYAGTKKGGVWKVDLVVGIDEECYSHPAELNLSQNYPNPFNPTTTINFSLTP